MSKKNTKPGKPPASSAKPGKKNAAPKQKRREKSSQPKVTTEYETGIPGTVITAIICLVLFALVLFLCINHEGILLTAIYQLLTGLLGRAGLYFSLPALFYLFAVNAFPRKNSVKMRSLCTVAFVICCGCIYHLVVQPQTSLQPLEMFPGLYQTGMAGRSGGVLCGSIAALLKWAFGSVISYFLIVLAAVLTLLGAMEITVPRLIRAFINRPRDDWEEKEQQEVYIDPAAKVVNHITNKKIEQKHQKRQQRQLEMDMLQSIPDNSEPPAPELPPPPPKKTAPPKKVVSNTKADTEKKSNTQPVQPPKPPVTNKNPPATDKQTSEPHSQEYRKKLLQAIWDDDIDSPIFGTGKKTTKPAPAVSEEDSLDHPMVKNTVVIASESKKKNTPDVPAVPDNKPRKGSKKEETDNASEIEQEIEQGNTIPAGAYRFPPIELLKGSGGSNSGGKTEIEEKSRRLSDALASFHIDAHITEVTRGPSVTRYEIELDKGVRLNKVTNCADDIALSLGVSGVRIAAVPDKISTVGIEVPNASVVTVSLRDVIASPAFETSKSKSSFAIGKDIGGSCIVGDISKMPHMLIAGTTGSGKSVCMNSIIISLLYKSAPEDVKLIMVDPKMVELGIYNGIPHLLIPVVTDPKKAAGALQWAVTEMLRRYKMMSDLGVRDLASYNSIVHQEEKGQKLPQVVIIIDELADLMLVAAKEVEDSICRIAQMGRAAGMHLIIATQRPSADVITGLMKANIPSRIAFSVASSMESRIILDTQGAEKLVGKGDMLYAPIGIGKPKRVQGCFVTDKEVEKVAKFVKDNSNAEYDSEIQKDIDQLATQAGKGSKTVQGEPEPSADELVGDELLPAAVDVILETGQASVSMLQRRLKLGYARAARIVDEMEEKGIVGPFQGSKPRAILMTKEQWAAMRGGIGVIGVDAPDNDDSPEELQSP